MTTPTTVLLLIDLQECLVSPTPEMGSRSTPSLTTNITTILHRWRALHLPLIHVNHHATDRSDPLHPSHPLTTAPHPCAAPLPTEPIRYKTTSSAFHSSQDGVSLAQALDAFKSLDGRLPKLALVGMDGAQCVNSTARTAADLGYEVTVVGDACASFGTEGWRGGDAWSAEVTHEVAMGVLAGGYARVVTSEEFLRGLE